MTYIANMTTLPNPAAVLRALFTQGLRYEAQKETEIDPMRMNRA